MKYLFFLAVGSAPEPNRPDRPLVAAESNWKLGTCPRQPPATGVFAAAELPARPSKRKSFPLPEVRAGTLAGDPHVPPGVNPAFQG